LNTELRIVQKRIDQKSTGQNIVEPRQHKMNKNTVKNTIEDEKVNAIRVEISLKGNELRQQYPWLNYQNTIGMTLFLLSIVGIFLTAWLYINNFIPVYLTIVAIALCGSVLHEIEHDLIHWQYFKQHKPVHHLMMFIVWAFRPTSLNPWIRRRIHLLHHKTSGTSADIEERGIGNGQSFSSLRWLIMLDTFTGNLVKIIVSSSHEKKRQHVLKILAANFPFPIACAICWYSFLMIHLLNSINIYAGLNVYGFGLSFQLWFEFWFEQQSSHIELLNMVVALWIAPSYLRSFCLNFISSNMHYYGDVQTLRQQTQVLNAWYFWPFQLFCFNFGSTHSIHHFVVGEPFFIRLLTVSAAHDVMRKYGIRFNDLGTFKRKNRYQLQKQQTNTLELRHE